MSDLRVSSDASRWRRAVRSREAKVVEPKEAYVKAVAKAEFKQLLDHGGFALELPGA